MSEKKETIGYVAGIKYNSEGKLIDWLYGKNGLTGYGEKPRIFKSERDARIFIEQKNHIGRPYVRPYYRYT